MIINKVVALASTLTFNRYWPQVKRAHLARFLVLLVVSLLVISYVPQIGKRPQVVLPSDGWTAQPMHVIQLDNPSNAPGYSPDQVRTAYDLPSTGGAGATIAIVDAYYTPSVQSDLAAFSSQFNLPSPDDSNFEVYNMTTNMTVSNSNWGIETCLDVEWAHAIAPDAKILLVEASDEGDGLFNAVDYARNLPDVVAISMSWGGSEFRQEAQDDSLFTSDHGIVFFASTGDSGGAAVWPSCSPNVVAVGGTSLLFSNGNVSSETAWRGSNGGLSAYEPIPDYQKNYGLTTTKRAVPDVSYDADPSTGVGVFYNSSWVVVGGTSVGSPQWAAIEALGLSSLSSNLYQSAKGAYSSYFRDIISGSNRRYSAGPGYDYVTGLGSPLTDDFTPPAPTPTPTSSPTPSASPSGAPTPSPSPTVSPTPTPTPSSSPNPTPTPTPTETPSPSPTPTPTQTPSPTPSPTPTPSPSPSPTPSPTPMPSPTPSPSPSPTPTASPMPTPTASPSPSPTPTPTPTPTATPTLTPTPSPTPTPTATPTPAPTPTDTPSTTPSQSPSSPQAPTATPNPTTITSPTPWETTEHSPTTSQTPSIPGQTELDISCLSTTSYSNFKVDITGNLTSDKIGVPNAQILLSYNVNAGNPWINITAINADANGNFATTWNPQTDGDYVLRAVYSGSENYSNSNSTISFVAMQSQEQSVLSVVSNSTVTSLSFNSTSEQLSFSTNGTSGTTGYVNVYLAKSLVSDVSNLKVYLDGASSKYDANVQGDALIISFTFSQSSHQVTIKLGSRTLESTSQLEQFSIIGVVASIIVIIAILLVVRKRRK